MSYARRSARVLLLDEKDRILLFAFPRDLGKPENGLLWLTPGGGVDKGELPHEAAARELREETGLAVAPASLLPMVASSEGFAKMSWAKGVFRDDYFLCRVPEHAVDMSGQEAWERAQIVDHRWWTIDELRASGESIVPLRLGDLLTKLISEGVPSRPLVLPWHH